jgi:hypothetical protein
MLFMGAITNAYVTIVRKPEEKRVPGFIGVHRIGPSEPQRNRM